jgi:hypothetical protein
VITLSTLKPEEPTVDNDKLAQDAIERPIKSDTEHSKMPVAGPHAEARLTDESKTPGAGTLPDKDATNVDPGAG